MDLRGAESRALGNLVSVPQPSDRLASVSVCPLGPGILQLVGVAFYEIEGPAFHSASGQPAPCVSILATSSGKKFLLGEDSGKSVSCGTRNEVL